MIGPNRRLTGFNFSRQIASHHRKRRCVRARSAAKRCKVRAEIRPASKRPHSTKIRERTHFSRSPLDDESNHVSRLRLQQNLSRFFCYRLNMESPDKLPIISTIVLNTRFASIGKFQISLLKREICRSDIKIRSNHLHIKEVCGSHRIIVLFRGNELLNFRHIHAALRMALDHARASSAPSCT